eukprot:1158509-Pelagomonas_calceolata.AAC.9
MAFRRPEARMLLIVLPLAQGPTAAGGEHAIMQTFLAHAVSAAAWRAQIIQSYLLSFLLSIQCGQLMAPFARTCIESAIRRKKTCMLHSNPHCTVITHHYQQHVLPVPPA